jgi:hypothetical protein
MLFITWCTLSIYSFTFCIAKFSITLITSSVYSIFISCSFFYTLIFWGFLISWPTSSPAFARDGHMPLHHMASSGITCVHDISPDTFPNQNKVTLCVWAALIGGFTLLNGLCSMLIIRKLQVDTCRAFAWNVKVESGSPCIFRVVVLSYFLTLCSFWLHFSTTIC